MSANMFNLEGYMVSLIASQFYHGHVKAIIDNTQTNEHGWVPIKLYS